MIFKKWRFIIEFKSKHTMPTKTGTKKSAKSEDEIKKKDATKSSKKSVEETSGLDLGSVLNDNTSAKLAAINATRGTSQLGTSSDDNTNKEAGISTSELSQHTDGHRELGEGGINLVDGTSGTIIPDVEIKYEEPILPNLIVLKFVELKF